MSIAHAGDIGQQLEKQRAVKCHVPGWGQVSDSGVLAGSGARGNSFL